MITYKPWLMDDHLALHAEYVLLPELGKWRDYIPVLWAAVLILAGTIISKLRRES
jgi:hypothetical protein